MTEWTAEDYAPCPECMTAKTAAKYSENIPEGKGQ